MDYINGLNERQKEAVLHDEGPLLILAGAGAGKTKTITHRIAQLIGSGVPGRAILAVTFTNKAAGEMRERVRALVSGAEGWPTVCTFHSLGVRILREFHAQVGLPRGFAIWDRDDSQRAVKRILDDLEVEDWAPRAILSTISRHKGDGDRAGEYEMDARTPREKIVARVWKRYEEALAKEDALDFDDLLARTLSLLANNKEVLSLLQNRWRYITIDEYQDTNRAQYEIARLLAGSARNLCVVGDTDQNIYSWRGADIEHLLTFEKSFPGAKVVLLEQNYRSTRTILAAANAVISKNTRRREKNLFTENETGESITLYAARNEVDEAWFVAQTARALMEEGMKPGEMTVLYRENFQSRALEEAMLAWSVPYRVIGVRFFERKEVKDALSYLRAALNPKSVSDIMRIVAVPPRGIGKVTAQKMIASEAPIGGAAGAKVVAFKQTIGKIRAAIHTLPTSEAVRFMLEESGMEKMFQNQGDDSSTSLGTSGLERLENVRELVNFATRYDDMQPPEGIEALLEEAALQSDQDEIPSERQGISLMTVHASKGLEFDTVFVTGLEQGLFPSTREETVASKKGGRDPEEERRLFYVALTRARKRLFLSYAVSRLRYGSREFTIASEFLEDIDPRLVSVVGREDSSIMHGGLID